MSKSTKPIEVNEILVTNVSISQFTNSKLSRSISEQVNRIHGTKDAGSFRKKLLPDEELSAIRKKATEIRQYQKYATLPWGWGGDCMVPLGGEDFYVSKYFNDIGKLETEFNELVEEFLTAYPKLRDQRRRELNGLYRESDYPTLNEMRSKFGVRFSCQKIDVSTDLRMSTVSKAVADQIRSRVSGENTSRHNRAVEEMYGRVKDVLDRILIVHGNRKEGDRRKFFKNTVMDVLGTIIETFPHLNYTNDPKIAKLTEELKSLLVDPANLRGDDEATKKYAKRAKEIEDKYFI